MRIGKSSLKKTAGVRKAVARVRDHIACLASGKGMPPPKVAVTREAKPVGDFAAEELGSLLETGFLRRDDLCQDPKSGKRIPLRKFLEGIGAPGYSAKKPEDPQPAGEIPPVTKAGRRRVKRRNRLRIPAVVPLSALVLAAITSLWALKATIDSSGFRKRLAQAEETNKALNKKFQNVLFAAREVAESDTVRGRLLLQDTERKRVVLPGIKMRLYRRADIEAHLSARQAARTESNDPNLLALHFLKNLPEAVEISNTNSDGRFEFRIPEPGEYVVQTSIRSAKTGAMRLWFVTFDSRDPLNTPVDITESNAVQQFIPLLMLVGGR